MNPVFLRRPSLERSWMSRLGLLGMVLLLSAPAQGQPAPKKGEAKGEEKAKTSEKLEGPQAEKAETTADRWVDPRAEAAMTKFVAVPNDTVSEAERASLKSWANGQGQPDAGVIRRFVRSRTFQLADKKNIQALESLSGKPDDAKAIERATTELLEPLLPPVVPNNARFRTLYVASLIDHFKPLWQGNLHSRTMAMIVLSRSADPQALRVFADQLRDADQLLIVKLLSAVGVSNVTRHGKTDPEGALGTRAAESLSFFLTNEQEVFWPAQFRALEGLGSLRMATAQPAAGKAEFAETAMSFLTDREAAPEVRVWAAWALGMMRVPGSVKDYNFKLVAHAMGEAALEIGERITKLPEKALPKMLRQTDLLIQLNRAFAGEPEIRDSGLMHSNNPALQASQSYVQEIDKRVKDVTKAAVIASQAVGTQLPKAREDLASRLKDLRTALGKNVPPAKALYEGGAEFPIAPPAKVADGVRP